MQRIPHTPHRSARRKVWAPRLAALLVVLVAGGCTAGGSSDEASSDAKQGDAALALPSPGKYRTLLEPCGAVPTSMLKDLLPGISSLSPDQQERALEGTPAVTYDTDRRVGCSWKADGSDASHRLSVDIERVVSYDTTVSDAERAEQVYAQKKKAAHIPDSDASGSPSPGDGSESSGNAEDSAGDGDDSASPKDTPKNAVGTSATPGTPAGPNKPNTQDISGAPNSTDAPGDGKGTPTASDGPSGSPSGSGTGAGAGAGTGGSPDDSALAPGLQPRQIGDLGDAAFVNDILTQSGSATQNRTVSVVFRTSNVIVTVTYTAQPTRPDEVPDSRELQDRAQALAKTLADEFDQ